MRDNDTGKPTGLLAEFEEDQRRQHNTSMAIPKSLNMDRVIRKAIRMSEPGSRHHLAELASIEKLLHKSIGIDEFFDKLTRFLDNKIPNIRTGLPLTAEQFRVIDDFTVDYFSSKLPETELWIVRAFVIGRQIQQAEQVPQGVQAIDVDKLPKTIQAATQAHNLVSSEVLTLEWLKSDGARMLTNASRDTVNRVIEIVSSNIKNARGWRELQKQLESELFDDAGESGRNWKRVAISETNSAFNQGYLAQLRQGEFVMGISFGNACDECLKMIHNKVYAFIDASVVAQFTGKDQEWLWENCIWVGKDNTGRSRAYKKQTPDGLVTRAHGERWMPCNPMHPECRCRWFKINPYTQFPDDGVLRTARGREEKWKPWFAQEVEPLVKKLQQFKIIS